MKTKGFTLVELLVVIAILAILATVSVVGYTSYINNANKSVAVQELTQVKSSLMAEDILNPNFAIGTEAITAVAEANENDDYDTLTEFLAALSANLNGTLSLGTDNKTVVYTDKDDSSITATWTIETGKVE